MSLFLNCTLQGVWNAVYSSQVGSAKQHKKTSPTDAKTQNVFTTINSELRKVPSHMESSPSYRAFKGFCIDVKCFIMIVSCAISITIKRLTAEILSKQAKALTELQSNNPLSVKKI